MYYNGKNYDNLAAFIEAKKEEWFDRDRKRGYYDRAIEKGWNDEGIVWAVQEYHSSMGEFTEDDIKTIEKEFGQWASDVIDMCEEGEEDDN